MAMSAPNPALLLVAAAACSTAPPTFPAHAPGVRIAPTQVARELSKSSKHLALPFTLEHAGTSGTALVLGYLQSAEAVGAKYVSDLSIVMQVVRNDVPVECVSRIALDDGHPAPAPPPPSAADPGDAEYSTNVQPWHPELVTTWVTDRELVCKKVGHQVIVPVPKYQDPYDVDVARFTPPEEMPSRREGQIEWADECHYEPKRHQVTRYDLFVVARFVPPELPQIAAQYSDWKLVEEPPQCHQLDASTKLEQRIEGELYFAGQLGDAKIPVMEKVPRAIR